MPFPYVDRLRVKRRPAVVISGRTWLDAHGLVWVVMVTSATNPPWPDDVAVEDFAAAGLPKPSVVRAAKVATVEAARCERLGRLPAGTARRVIATLRAELGPRGRWPRSEQPVDWERGPLTDA